LPHTKRWSANNSLTIEVAKTGLLGSFAPTKADNPKAEDSHRSWFWNCCDNGDIVDVIPDTRTADERDICTG
jgi:hypothetical protein